MDQGFSDRSGRFIPELFQGFFKRKEGENKNCLRILLLIKLTNYYAESKMLSIKVHHAERKEEPKRANTVGKPQQFTKPEEPLKYFLGPGNNSELIKRVIKTRNFWV